MLNTGRSGGGDAAAKTQATLVERIANVGTVLCGTAQINMRE